MYSEEDDDYSNKVSLIEKSFHYSLSEHCPLLAVLSQAPEHLHWVIIEDGFLLR